MGQVVLRALLCGLLAAPAQALELSRSGVEIPAGTSLARGTPWTRRTILRSAPRGCTSCLASGNGCGSCGWGRHLNGTNVRTGC